MTTQDLYIQLEQIEILKNKISLIQKDNPENIFLEECIKLYFHEHLTVLIALDEVRQECYVEYNKLTHCHIDVEDIFDDLIFLAEGNLIFIEKRRLIGKNYLLTIVDKVTFDKIKKLFLRSKWFKIYSAKGLIH